jgi:hypothetical protein
MTETKYPKVEGTKGKKAFAYMRDAKTGKVYPITDDDAVYGRKIGVLKKDKKLAGIKYSMSSRNIKCPYKKDKKGKALNFKTTYKITCNEKIKG